MSAGRHGGRPSGAPQELWLITYGDLVTLLMAFFVMLYATLTGKAQGAGEAVTQALQRHQREIFTQIASGAGGGVILMPGSDKLNVLDSQGPDLFQRDLSDWTARVTGYAEVQAAGDQIKVTLGADVLFDSGMAELRAQGRQALRDLAQLLVEHAGDVTVMGHTDPKPFPEVAGGFRDNWMLSAARAVSVVRELESAGVEPGRLKAIGYGATRPRDAEGRTGGAYDEWQRRVELLITPAEQLGATADGTAFPESGAETLSSTAGKLEAPAGMEGMELLRSYPVVPDQGPAGEPEPPAGPLGEPPPPGAAPIDREIRRTLPPDVPPMPGRSSDLDAGGTP